MSDPTTIARHRLSLRRSRERHSLAPRKYANQTQFAVTSNGTCLYHEIHQCRDDLVRDTCPHVPVPAVGSVGPGRLPFPGLPKAPLYFIFTKNTFDMCLQTTVHSRGQKTELV